MTNMPTLQFFETQSVTKISPGAYFLICKDMVKKLVVHVDNMWITFGNAKAIFMEDIV